MCLLRALQSLSLREGVIVSAMAAMSLMELSMPIVRDISDICLCAVLLLPARTEAAVKVIAMPFEVASS
jgi:hypothetical protein